MIVEDEEAARDHLSLILRRKFPEFEIIGEAENGQECLELLKGMIPDVIISDIRMPVMDGLELMEILSRDYPEIQTLIVSGYEDFEYARNAFRCGVEDYLLKPVKLDKLQGILEKTASRIKERQTGETIRLFENLILRNRESTNPSGDERQFRTALFRLGGHVSRFYPGRRSSENFVRNGVYGIQGRDGNEWFLVGSAGDFSRHEFISWVEEFRREEAYATAVFHEGSTPFDSLRDIYTLLCSLTDRSIRPGRRIFLCQGEDREEHLLLPDLPVGRIEYALSTGNPGELKSILREELGYLEEKSVSLIRTEQRIKELFHLIRRERLSLGVGEGLPEWDIPLELQMTECRSYGDLSRRLEELLSESFEMAEGRSSEQVMPLFFKAVCRYVEHNYRERVGISDLSARFNLSESYLTKLFRKHLNCSFTEYLKTCRIEAAKALMQSNPEITVQEAARHSGFDDQFYFSKVFKQITGQSPSGYMKGLPAGG